MSEKIFISPEIIKYKKSLENFKSLFYFFIGLTTKALFKHFYIDGKVWLANVQGFLFLPTEQVTRSVDTLTEHTYDIISVHRSILNGS